MDTKRMPHSTYFSNILEKIEICYVSKSKNYQHFVFITMVGFSKVIFSYMDIVS